MNSSKFVFISVRLFSRSSCLSKKPEVSTKKDVLNLKDDVKVPVETDTERLATYLCGSNLFAEGGEDIKLKPDSEYPDWLWTMRSPPPLEELDKNSKTYWNRLGRIREKEIKHIKSLIRNSWVHK